MMIAAALLKGWIVTNAVIALAVLGETSADSTEPLSPDCDKIKELMIGTSDRECRTPGPVGIKGQCSVYKMCSAILKVPLTKSPCPPKTTFKPEQRRCVDESSDSESCDQILCYPRETEKLAEAQSTGPAHKSNWNSNVEKDKNVPLPSASKFNKPLVSLTFVSVVSFLF